MILDIGNEFERYFILIFRKKNNSSSHISSLNLSRPESNSKISDIHEFI